MASTPENELRHEVSRRFKASDRPAEATTAAIEALIGRPHTDEEFQGLLDLRNQQWDEGRKRREETYKLEEVAGKLYDFPHLLQEALLELNKPELQPPDNAILDQVMGLINRLGGAATGGLAAGARTLGAGPVGDSLAELSDLLSRQADERQLRATTPELVSTLSEPITRFNLTLDDIAKLPASMLGKLEGATWGSLRSEGQMSPAGSTQSFEEIAKEFFSRPPREGGF